MADRNPRRALPDTPAVEPKGEPTRVQETKLDVARKRYALVSDLLTPQRLGLVLAVALLGLIGAVGGWDAIEGVEAPEVPRVEVGEPIKAHPFEITVRRARHFDALEGALYREEGQRYLVVSLDVTLRNDVHVPGETLRDALHLDAPGLKMLALKSGPSPERPRLLRGLDALDARTYQPGLEVPTIAVWQQEVGAPIPDEVTVTFDRQTWRASSLDGSMRWFDPTPVARVTLPLEALEAP